MLQFVLGKLSFCSFMLTQVENYLFDGSSLLNFQLNAFKEVSRKTPNFEASLFCRLSQKFSQNFPRN
jgi:hypothetical protein